jgi:hypothetical protein
MAYCKVSSDRPRKGITTARGSAAQVNITQAIAELENLREEHGDVNLVDPADNLIEFDFNDDIEGEPVIVVE